MKQHFLWLLIIMIITPFTIYSQNKLPGIVIKLTDDHHPEPLAGANIQWLHDAATGAVTNESGIAVLPLSGPLPQKAVISYVGYIADTILITGTDTLELHLHPDMQLSEVHVTAKKQSNFISSLSSAKTEKITDHELKKAACCNLSESFQTNASIDVSYQDAVSGAKEIKLLGLSGLYVQNLLEGMPFLRGLTTTFGLDNLPSPWIKSISVSKGIPSVKNSYEGLSGSLNIDLKSSINDTQRLYIDFFANQNGRIENNLIINHKINPKLGMVLMTNGAFTPVKQDMNHDGFLDQPVAKQYNLLHRWDYRGEKAEGQYAVKVLSENRIAGESGEMQHSDMPHPKYTIGIRTKRVEAFAKTGFFLKKNDASIGTQFSGVYHLQNAHYGVQQYHGEQGSFSGNILYQTNIRSEQHQLVAGTNFMYDHMDEALDSIHLRYKDFIPGLFAEYTYRPTPKITVVGAFRGDYHTRAGWQFSPRVHARFVLDKYDRTTLRIAGGRGFRAPNILTENQALFASSRQIVVQQQPMVEAGWNYGISLQQKFELGGREGSVTVDFFRTDFTRQSVTDIDLSNGQAVIAPLEGKSFSNSLLMEFNYEAVKGLDVKLAYRLEDVRTTYHGTLLRKAMLPMHKGLLALSYRTPNQQWQFDMNTHLFGKRRRPNSFAGDEGSRYTPRYVLLNAQITKYFKRAEIFLGAENITNYKPKDLILGMPYSAYFDTYQVYAPAMGASVYGGVRVFIQ